MAPKCTTPAPIDSKTETNVVTTDETGRTYTTTTTIITTTTVVSANVSGKESGDCLVLGWGTVAAVGSDWMRDSIVHSKHPALRDPLQCLKFQNNWL